MADYRFPCIRMIAISSSTVCQKALKGLRCKSSPAFPVQMTLDWQHGGQMNAAGIGIKCSSSMEASVKVNSFRLWCKCSDCHMVWSLAIITHLALKYWFYFVPFMFGGFETLKRFSRGTLMLHPMCWSIVTPSSLSLSSLLSLFVCHDCNLDGLPRYEGRAWV